MEITRQQKIDLVAAELRRRFKEMHNQGAKPARKPGRLTDLAAEIAIDITEQFQTEGKI